MMFLVYRLLMYKCPKMKNIAFLISTIHEFILYYSFICDIICLDWLNAAQCTYLQRNESYGVDFQCSVRSCLGPYEPAVGEWRRDSLGSWHRKCHSVARLKTKHLMTIYYSQHHRKKPNLLFKCLCSNETLKNDDEFNNIVMNEHGNIYTYIFANEFCLRIFRIRRACLQTSTNAPQKADCVTDIQKTPLGHASVETEGVI